MYIFHLLGTYIAVDDLEDDSLPKLYNTDEQK